MKYFTPRWYSPGGSGAIEQGVSNEAEYARVLLEQLGLPPNRATFENTSRTGRRETILPPYEWPALICASTIPIEGNP
jgi:hypothetical protein